MHEYPAKTYITSFSITLLGTFSKTTMAFETRFLRFNIYAYNTLVLRFHLIPLKSSMATTEVDQ